MADKPKDKGGKKPSGGGGVKGDMEVLGTIVGIAVGLVLLSTLMASFQNRFADGGRLDVGSWVWRWTSSFSSRVNEFTPAGALVTTKQKTDVWASALRDRILGVQPKGAHGKLLSSEVIGDNVRWLVDFESGVDGWVSASDLTKQLSETAGSVRTRFLWVSAILSILGVAVALYSWRRWLALVSVHKKQMKLLEKKLVGEDIANKNERWEHVETLVSSENPGDWRVAIIEADVMLDELVTAMGYDGETLGDKLKRIEKSDFLTLDAAWEAHKVRNRVAHHGSDFILTSREAKRVIALYRQALEEFDYV